jgi:hypothetical protein
VTNEEHWVGGSHGDWIDTMSDEFCPGGAVVPVVEVQWCDTHKANAPSVGGMCWIATVVATSGHSTEEPCHVVTRHMLEVSE